MGFALGVADVVWVYYQIRQYIYYITLLLQTYNLNTIVTTKPDTNKSILIKVLKIIRKTNLNEQLSRNSGNWMLKTLREYRKKLSELPQTQHQQLQQIKAQYIEIFAKQLEHSAQEHFKRYRDNKKVLDDEFKAVNYYLRIGEISQKLNQSDSMNGLGLSQVQEHQQGQESSMVQKGKDQKEKKGDSLSQEYINDLDISKITQQQKQQWQETLRKVNLYSLFKTIDDKLAFNKCLLKSFKLTCNLPPLSQNHLEHSLTTLRVKEQQLQQYSNLISQLLTKLNRPCKQQHALYVSIQEKYTNLLKYNVQQEKNNKIKIKDSLNYIVARIEVAKYLKDVEIDVVTGGIIDVGSYERLGVALVGHRFYLRNLHIRLMDMQFCQQKCDVLKRYLKKLKVLQKLIIQNYYSECKLGMFVDFGWQPYRKTINIKAGVWK